MYKVIVSLRKKIRTQAYIDMNHACNIVNRRSYLANIIHVNNTLIIWQSKRQNTVKALSFEIKYVALWITKEIVEVSFRVLINGIIEIFCNNKLIVTNSSIPTLVMNKRHNAICYNSVREA